MRRFAMDDLMPGQAVTVDNVFYKHPETQEWQPCGMGAMWVGNAPDFRGDLFRVVSVDLPFVAVDMLCNSLGSILTPPKRLVFDCRHITFRKMSDEFVAEMLKKPTSKPTLATGGGAPPRLTAPDGTVVEVIDGRTGRPTSLPPALASLLGFTRKPAEDDSGPGGVVTRDQHTVTPTAGEKIDNTEKPSDGLGMELPFDPPAAPAKRGRKKKEDETK